MDVQDALRFVEGCIDRYAEQAWRAAYVMLSNAADADDLLQQSFLVAWRKAEFAPRENAWPWLAAIIANEAANFRRKRKRRQGPSLDSISEPAMENDPNKNLERIELAALVHVSLAQLDEDQRIAIVLTHLGGLSQSEAASALGLPLNTLKARVRRGLDSLRDALGRTAPDLEKTLKTLPVAPPIGGLIAAKSAWSAGLASNVAVAGTATVGVAGGFKALIATAAAVVIVAAGVVGAIVAPPADKPAHQVAQEIREEPANPTSQPPKRDRPASNKLAPMPEVDVPTVPEPVAEPKPKPERVPPQPQPETEPLPEPESRPERETHREPVPAPIELPSGYVSSKENRSFWEIWRDKKATILLKNDAVNNLIGGAELLDEYLEILESDIWQYRATVTGRIQAETNNDLLTALEEFLFDEKQVEKKPAAGEHVCWALYNNATWATEHKWLSAPQLITSRKTPKKVKARMLREMGVFRGSADIPAEGNAAAQKTARTNVMTLVNLLAVALQDKKYPRDLKFLIFDSLESLTSQNFREDMDHWMFFANNMKESEPLTPRSADAFKDAFTDVEIEGRSFASPTPRPTDMEVLVLSDLGSSDLYWRPYLNEINKTFKCTYVDLPDCSRMKNLEWMKNSDGSENRTAYYFPLQQFVETLEERREQSKQKQFGLIAHGTSAWIAMEYMRLHPESVAFSVIIGTWSGEDSYQTGLSQCQNSKIDAYKWYAESLRYDPSGRSGALAMNEEQAFWAKTGNYARRWADPKAMEPIFYAQPQWRWQPQDKARILVPRFEFESKRKIDVPTLFIHGTKDPTYVAKDEADYKKGFSNMVWAEFENSAGTPWAEEPERFFTEFETLLEKNKIIEKLKK